jgi:microcystin-dependent protein
MSEPFVAEIRIWALSFAPRGWAFCNGQLLPIAQNTALFSLIGTTYGGDGRSTTALPNLQGRAPMQPRSGPGLTHRQLGENGGVETVTLSLAQMANHNHSLMAANVPASVNAPSNTTALARSANGAAYNTGGTADAPLHTDALPPAGGSSPT